MGEGLLMHIFGQENDIALLVHIYPAVDVPGG